MGSFDHHKIDVGLQMPDEVMKCHCSWLYPHALISAGVWIKLSILLKNYFYRKVKNGYRFIEDFVEVVRTRHFGKAAEIYILRSLQ